MVITPVMVVCNKEIQQYHGTAVFTAVKSFITLAPGNLYTLAFQFSVPNFHPEKCLKLSG
jgi:hypothetical protein